MTFITEHDEDQVYTEIMKYALFGISVIGLIVVFLMMGEDRVPVAKPAITVQATPENPLLERRITTHLTTLPISIAALEIKAKNNKPEAQALLGMLYFVGNGVDRDHQKAVSWIQKSADSNFAESQFLLGIMYFFGAGVQVNQHQSVAWLERAAANHHPDAIAVLALLQGA